MKKITALFAVLILAGCAMLGVENAPTPARKFNETDFRQFLGEVKQEALAQGISRQTADENLDHAEYLPKVIALDYRQREKFIPFSEYISSVLTEKKVQDANLFYHENLPLLQKISGKYGVDAKVIVALWGMESNFGRYTGNYSVISALATLAYDGKRAEFFRQELINALRVSDEGNIKGPEMKGSWAGAMGQNQFMPSTFLAYAVDEDHDGHKDIWNDKADIFGSIANYLHNLGWKKQDGICRKATLPDDFNLSEANIKNEHPVSYWKAKNVKIIKDNGAEDDKTAALVNLENDDDIVKDGHYYIVYNNYKRIMKWNRSLYFATSICLMADAIH